MNQPPGNSLRIYDVNLVTSYLIGLIIAHASVKVNNVASAASDGAHFS